jgi:hypothetical protein
VALTWNKDTITSDRTPHSARPIDGSLDYWEVSYLPGMRMEYDDAYMAMTIADRPCLGDKDLTLSDWDSRDIGTWVRQGLWADILGLDIDEVRESVSRPPAWDAGDKGCYEHHLEHLPEQRQQSRQEAVKAAIERDDPEAGG